MGLRPVVWFEFDKETDWRLAARSGQRGRAARAVLHGPGWRQGGNLTAVESSLLGRTR